MSSLVELVDEILALVDPTLKSSAPNCIQWMKGRCLYEKCKFTHEPSLFGVEDPSKTVNRPKVNGRRRKRRHASRRHSIVRHWMLDTFGRECLRAGVADIAAGKGTLAFELLNLNGISSKV